MCGVGCGVVWCVGRCVGCLWHLGEGTSSRTADTHSVVDSYAIYFFRRSLQPDGQDHTPHPRSVANPTHTASDRFEDDDGDVGPPDGSFLPLSLNSQYPDGSMQDLPQTPWLVDITGDELGTRGLTTPPRPFLEADRQWRQQARLAEPHKPSPRAWLGRCSQPA